MYTRKQYMAKEVTHQEYYEQFGKYLVGVVNIAIGESRIKNSTDDYFNDIPLKEWDVLAGIARVIVGRSIAKANGNGTVSLSDYVCSAKAAARIIKRGT